MGFIPKDIIKGVRFFKKAEEKLAALDYSSAKEQALKLLSDKEKYRCVPKSPAQKVPNTLPSLLRELFERYSEIQTLGPVAAAEVRLSLADIQGSSYGSEFIKIGTNVSQSELLVVAGDERIFDIGPNEAGEDPREYSNPSVYHWIIMNSLIYHDYIMP